MTVARSAPRRVLAAGALWLILGAGVVAFGAAALIAGHSSGSSASSDSASAQLGDGVETGASGATSLPSLIAIVCGAAMIVLTGLLIARRSWARLGLEMAGAVAVIDLAVQGQGLAFVAMALLVLASVPTMSVVTHRYLYDRSSPAADQGPR